MRRALLTGTSAVAALSCVLATSSCGSDQTDAKADPTASPSSTAAHTGSSAAPAGDVDHAMPSPGPRTSGLVAPADIIVTSPTTIGADTIDAVKKLKGVTDVDVISMAQPIIEDQAITVAAVDPATYRNYTPLAAADTQAVWDRVADGELALKPQQKKRLPISDQGYLKLGTVADAPDVHIGAFSPQSPLIDAVVNTSWIKTLGMTPDNALLIRTGTHVPQQVQKPLTALLGQDVSIQLADVASRKGLDPQAQQVAVVTGTVSDAVGVYRYSVLGGGRIAPAASWVADHITTETVPILGSVTCNRLIFPQLRAALDEVLARGLADKIKPSEYAGCYYPRFIAGTTTLSNHAFGLALDINAIENQRGTVGTMDPGVVQAFEKWGFTWGGTWHYTDPMHFEMNQLVTPGGAGDADDSSTTANAKSEAASPSR